MWIPWLGNLASVFQTFLFLKTNRLRPIFPKWEALWPLHCKWKERMTNLDHLWGYSKKTYDSWMWWGSRLRRNPKARRLDSRYCYGHTIKSEPFYDGVY